MKAEVIEDDQLEYVELDTSIAIALSEARCRAGLTQKELESVSGIHSRINFLIRIHAAYWRTGALHGIQDAISAQLLRLVAACEGVDPGNVAARG
jgi:hypothetical protein